MSIQKKLGKKPRTIDKNTLVDLTREICSVVSKISLERARSLTSSKPNVEIILINRPDGIFHFDHNACASLDKATKLVKFDPIYIEDLSEKSIYEKYKNLIISLFLAGVGSDPEIKVRLNSFLTELKTSIKEYRVMMPIEQLELSDLDEVKIGNVRLVPFSSLNEENDKTKESDAWKDIKCLDNLMNKQTYAR